MATISIADSDARVQYTQAVTANSTQLTIDFPFFSLDDINVIVTSAAGVDTTLTRGSGTGTFAVVGTSVDDGFSGGYVTLGDTYSDAATKYTIFRDIDIERTTDFPTSGPFNISSLNTELDKIFAIEQELETKVGRTIKLPDSDSGTAILPNASARSNKYMAFDSSGDLIATAGTADTTPISSAMTPVVGGSTLANARTEFFSGTNLSFDGSGNVKSTNVVADVLQLDDDDDSNSIKLQAPSAVTTTTTFTLPNGDGDSGQTLITNGSGALSFAEPYGNRNLLINGAMKVAQRNTSKASLSSTSVYSTCDRWLVEYGSSGTFTESQSSTSPDGFSDSLKLDCTTADASPNYLIIEQRLEGQDLQHLLKGTSSSKKTILSFHVRSNKTGTYQVNLRDIDNARIIGKTYTISSANTWEKKTITFDGDTSGALDNDNANSMQIEWWLAAGSTYNSGAVPTAWEATANGDRAAGLNVAIGASTDDEFYLTGAQLEVGDVDTPFEHRSFGDELARCQRYFESVRIYMEGKTDAGGSDHSHSVSFAVKKRATPAVVRTSIGANTNISSHITSSGLDISGAFTRNRSNAAGAIMYHDQLDCESELL